MPITKSAKKALRASRQKLAGNLIIRKKLKDAIKKTDSKNIAKTFSAIDKAAKKGIIHPNKAAHLKSQLSKKVSTATVKSEKPKATRTKKKTKKAKK